MQKKLWICDRCEAEDVSDGPTAYDAMPRGWSKFHRYAPAGHPESAPEYVHDLCGACIEAFVAWMQGDSSDMASTTPRSEADDLDAEAAKSLLRYAYECPNRHTWMLVSYDPAEWSTCPKCGRPGTYLATNTVPRLAENVMTSAS